MKLARKTIKLRNIIILFVIVTIIVSILVFVFPKFEINQSLYTEQTKSLIKNAKSLKENTEAKIYYVSENGISTDGTDINNPMSLEVANKKTYYGNEKILFKAGDIFYGTINFNVITNEKEMFYIGAYGEGEKPIINGSYILINPNAWQKEENLYKIDLSKYNNFIGIQDTKLDRYNIGFISSENGTIYGNRKSKKELVVDEYDFFCEKNYLYLKCLQNPTTKLGKIRFVGRNNLVQLCSNTILEGLNIQYTGAHGIVKKNNEIVNSYILNCIIQNIGGSVQIDSNFTRYGNGIEFWNQAQNTIVENNIIKDIYDAGYTIQGNTVKTGFYNNICRNNIFIRCTYTYELFCHNKESASHGEIKGFNYYNNISINQGRGWGYKVRPDKDPAAEEVIWTISNPNGAEIKSYNNTYFNSRKLKFIVKNTLEINPNLQTIITSDYNKIYLNKDTLLFGNIGNYNDKSILERYKIEQNSTFRTLSRKEIEQIENNDVLESNNYEKIKMYYEKLESNFIYEDIISKLLSKYEALENEDNGKLYSIVTDITNLKSYISNISMDTINKTDVVQLVGEHYELGNKLIKECNAEEIRDNETELIYIFKNLAEIGDIYIELLVLSNQDMNFDKGATKKIIDKVSEKIELNYDLDMTYPSELLDLSKNINDKEYNSYGENIKAKQLANWAKEFTNIYIQKHIENNPVSVSYSEKNITNKDVETTLNSENNVKIVNNSNSNKYIFEQNGEFTFEYIRRGQEFKEKVIVNNIDKISPTIEGVKEGKIYNKEVTIKITDENLKDVILTLNGQVVNGYKVEDKLKEEGIYIIEATDQAGNKTSVTFEILYNINNEYIIEENTIKNIQILTNLENLKQKLDLKIEYKILRGETELTNQDIMSTGDILELKDGKKYTLIVKGDITKNGKSGARDLVMLKQYILDKIQLDNITKNAADLNMDNKVNSLDIVKLRQQIIQNIQ